MPLLALLLPLGMLGLIFALGYYEDRLLHHPYRPVGEQQSSPAAGDQGAQGAPREHDDQ